MTEQRPDSDAAMLGPMESPNPEILILDRPIAPAELGRLARDTFTDMVKYVVDPALRARIRNATHVLVGRGEAI